MYELHPGFVGRPYLRSVWSLDYEAFKDSEIECDVISKLTGWSKRKDLKETSAESAFLDTFFRDVWGYAQSGQETGPEGFTLYPKFPVAGAGEKGGTGEADLAIGWFDRDGVPPTPQILCEFKDIRSSLDAPQKGRRNKRSPVKQCLDYLNAARRGMFGNEGILPTWGIATDMNEFRLYWYDRAPQQFLRFVIQPGDLFQGRGQRKAVRTTNAIERRFREVRRRTRPMGVFADRTSMDRILFAVFKRENHNQGGSTPFQLTQDS